MSGFVTPQRLVFLKSNLCFCLLLYGNLLVVWAKQHSISVETNQTRIGYTKAKKFLAKVLLSHLNTVLMSLQCRSTTMYLLFQILDVYQQ